MPVNLSIKDVPDDLAERLRQRAARHHRSLQGELMAIVEQASLMEPAGPATPVPAVAAVGGAARSWTQGWKTVEQLMAERQARGWKPHASLAAAPLGVDIIRADRDSR
jgi:plasmid stability protein